MGSWGIWGERGDWSSCDMADARKDSYRTCEKPADDSHDYIVAYICNGNNHRDKHCSAVELQCGTTGKLKSPNHPYSYGNNLKFMEEITSGLENTHLDLTIEVQGIEFGQNCEFDYLEIIDRKSEKSLVGKICGSNIRRRVSANSNEVDVIFHTDGNVVGSGWTISWCAPQVVTSPNWPSVYGNNQDVTQKITVDAGMRIKFEFLEFDVEGSSSDNCPYDWVDIINADEFAKRRGFKLAWAQTENI